MKTVLAIVEAQEMGQLLRHGLGRRYNLTVCRTADEGAILLQQKPDALILDLHIPGSLSLLEHPTTSLPPVVIAMTAVCTRPVLLKAAQLGVDCLIRIPCTGTQIAHHLEMLLCKKDPSLSGG